MEQIRNPGRALFALGNFHSPVKSQREDVQMSNAAASRAELLPAGLRELLGTSVERTGQNKPQNPEEDVKAQGPDSKKGILQQVNFSR